MQARPSLTARPRARANGCLLSAHPTSISHQLAAKLTTSCVHASEVCGRWTSTIKAPCSCCPSTQGSTCAADLAHGELIAASKQHGRTKHARAWLIDTASACHSDACCNHHLQSSSNHLHRRSILLGSAAVATTLAAWTGAAQASKLPAFADRAWEALGGGPSDLTFPEAFLGVWDVTSMLTQVELPLGESMAADMQVVRRAQQEDLDKPIRYQVAFVRNRENNVVYDRAFNTASMLSHYYRRPASDFLTRITWNTSDPNVLELNMPGGMFIRTRVTRRSEQRPTPDRIETSEYIEQVFDSSSMSESSGPAPKLKASQCFTKYKFRDERGVPAGQPAIVATQVVSDYLDPRTDDVRAIEALNRPVTLYTYKLAFTRAAMPTN